MGMTAGSVWNFASCEGIHFTLHANSIPSTEAVRHHLHRFSSLLFLLQRGALSKDLNPMGAVYVLVPVSNNRDYFKVGNIFLACVTETSSKWWCGNGSITMPR